MHYLQSYLLILGMHHLAESSFTYVPVAMLISNKKESSFLTLVNGSEYLLVC